MIPAIYFTKLGTSSQTLVLPTPGKRGHRKSRGMGDATTAKAFFEMDKRHSIAQSRTANHDATAQTEAKSADISPAKSSGNAITTEVQNHQAKKPPTQL